MRCCGAVGPASAAFRGPAGGIPQACCARDRDDAAGAGAAGDGLCAHLHTRGCVVPAADRVRAVLRDGAAANGGAALLMFLCALSTALYADALKRERRKRKELQEVKEEKPLRSPILNEKF
ncbi:hypothetical protein ONE63_005905 [Megalurothrips usitatus]|uniref:Uncharacterized protein n=1 Tax=Megalurothrips usitatus TaxID=439358 RepID=A0AAV7Y124_9NEOP|nr:hypothetical protein ONE63_005905 [Megalurothrips usitatus]